MSKELIEQVKATLGINGDSIGRKIVGRIEQLEAEVAGWKASAENRLEIQRQREEQLAAAQAREAELMADNVRLREALESARTMIGHPDNIAIIDAALAATPEQSLALYHNEVVEKCAKGCDAEYRDPHNLPAAIVAKRCADTVRAMKVPE